MGNFERKVCLVTGGTSGIGLATVRRFIAEGARVAFCGRNAEAGNTVYNSLPKDRALFVSADVGNESAVERLFEHTVGHFGHLDVLINNAGRGAIKLIQDMTTEHWRRSAASNLDSVFFCSRAAVRLMRRQGGGTVVNVASISGISGDGAFPAYCAHKAAVINLTRSMAAYHARENIRINALCPGLVETPATELFNEVPNLKERWLMAIPCQRAGTVEEIAAAILFLASDEASYIHGATLVVDGGVTASTGQPTQVPPI